MARITFANALAGIRNAFGPGGQLRAKEQLSAVVDGLLQLVGNANITPGGTESSDPLNSPFTLYVNPYIGSDRFVAGSYNWFEEPGDNAEAIIAAQLKRLENQRLVCGFSQHRPFRTINRAIIEAAIITSKNWYSGDPMGHLDCVSIVLAPAVHIAYNNPSADGIAVSQWGDGFDPTPQHLIAFNAAEGGLLFPRGSSLVSLHGDLRHTIIRPSWVPNGNVDEIPTYANGVATYALRRQICKVTGGGYAFGLTFRDKLGATSSHHLLSAFGHATRAELNEFYDKVWSACGSGGNLSRALLAARETEYKIAAPISGNPSASWDSTESASFYVFQCSVRSDYGMGRLWADGTKVEGFKSFVLANYTGVSLQKGIPSSGSNQNDLNCWQKYINGSWQPVSSYADYIAQSPDNIRPNPLRRSVGVGAINEAFIQKVSIFDIGESVQSYVDAGGEIDSNNGNSSFGGCAGLARGYRSAALPQDRSWQVSAIRVPLSPGEKTGNIQRFYLGTVAAISSGSITLTTALAHDTSSTGPSILGSRGYSLRAGSYIWIENPQGVDWRAPAAAFAWSSAAPTVINIANAATDPGGVEIGVGGNGVSLAIGSRVYVRRLIDTRTPAERRLSLLLNNGTRARIPAAHYVLQTDPTHASASIARYLTSTELILATTTGVGGSPGAGVLTTAEVTIRRGGTPTNYANDTFYRAGTVVQYANKHWVNSRDFTTTQASPDPRLWQETFVHMEESYAPEDNLRNEAPILVFDTDTDGNDVTVNCGINWSTAWTSNASIYSQYRTGVDYLGAHLFMTALGYSAADAHAALVPRAESSRNRNPALTSSPASTLALSSVIPAGGAAAGPSNWAVEWRRPSTLWMGGHRWFGSGAGNYSKAVPKAVQDMSAQNRFTYLFTSQGGGRCIPQGSQEDGLLVSPRGLEDVATGITQSVDNLGSGDINANQSDERSSLTILSLLNLGSAVIEGNPNWADGALPSSTTTQKGIIRIATINETLELQSDTLAASPKAIGQAISIALRESQLPISLSPPSSINIGQSGKVVALYKPEDGWQLTKMVSPLTFNLAPATAASTIYDIYLYNTGTPQSPSFGVEYVPWTSWATPPTRGLQDGVVVRNNNPIRRLVGHVLTRTAGVGGEVLPFPYSDHTKVGTVRWQSSNFLPIGWLRANGNTVSRSEYAMLFHEIGTIYGSGNGSTTFTLPDLRGEFIRGFDDGRNVDTGRTFGSAQADQFKTHFHSYNLAQAPGSGQDQAGSGSGDGVTQFPSTTSEEGGTETRPRNIAMLGVIKF